MYEYKSEQEMKEAIQQAEDWAKYWKKCAIVFLMIGLFFLVGKLILINITVWTTTVCIPFLGAYLFFKIYKNWKRAPEEIQKGRVIKGL